MCLKCVSEKAPDRGTTCNDTGAFMMNYLGCIECKSLQLVSTARQETEEDGEELLEFARTLSSFGSGKAFNSRPTLFLFCR
eukprot:m.48187 g.48187  ORF g.48187 m.48187 type:complete len:81 (+) comp47686_c0_seq4:274-516(+)